MKGRESKYIYGEKERCMAVREVREKNYKKEKGRKSNNTFAYIKGGKKHE